ncbi:hypothetical protein VP01_3441g1 [Puccinia sorghi]|uniref:Uncharacterized protein n=1 Tax=Puccinia sorghi TaxID=27349 RepID=A0A0L6UX53_9BASI|nr:hypothetical protein VP01_3441g1 [Puccinia sorghi]
MATQPDRNRNVRILTLRFSFHFQIISPPQQLLAESNSDQPTYCATSTPWDPSNCSEKNSHHIPPMPTQTSHITIPLQPFSPRNLFKDSPPPPICLGKMMEKLLTGECTKVLRLEIIPQLGKPLASPEGGLQDHNTNLEVEIHYRKEAFPFTKEANTKGEEKVIEKGMTTTLVDLGHLLQLKNSKIYGVQQESGFNGLGFGTIDPRPWRDRLNCNSIENLKKLSGHRHDVTLSSKGNPIPSLRRIESQTQPDRLTDNRCNIYLQDPVPNVLLSKRHPGLYSHKSNGGARCDTPETAHHASQSWGHRGSVQHLGSKAGTGPTQNKGTSPGGIISLSFYRTPSCDPIPPGNIPIPLNTHPSAPKLPRALVRGSLQLLQPQNLTSTSGKQRDTIFPQKRTTSSTSPAAPSPERIPQAQEEPETKGSNHQCHGDRCCPEDGQKSNSPPASILHQEFLKEVLHDLAKESTFFFSEMKLKELFSSFLTELSQKFEDLPGSLLENSVLPILFNKIMAHSSHTDKGLVSPSTVENDPNPLIIQISMNDKVNIVQYNTRSFLPYSSRSEPLKFNNPLMNLHTTTSKHKSESYLLNIQLRGRHHFITPQTQIPEMNSTFEEFPFIQRQDVDHMGKEFD